MVVVGKKSHAVAHKCRAIGVALECGPSFLVADAVGQATGKDHSQKLKQ